MVKEFVCIVCPNGCNLRTEELDRVIAVTGQKCPKGEEYAKIELICPTRTLTSTVSTSFPSHPILPVRTSDAIPKGKIMNAMKEINRIVVTERLKCGDVVVKDFIGAGVDLIATDDIDVN